jgi:hypothetical protein
MRPILLALGPLLPLAAGDGDPGYVLHEWGTFTALAGSDGVLIGGLDVDEEPLPGFVHRRDDLETGFPLVTIKMETPVIYVYSDRARTIDLSVGFPEGILTQWFPQVRHTAPPVTGDPPDVRGGSLRWGRFQVLAPGDGLGALPAVEEGDSWAFAREVDANVLRLCLLGADEHEKFLFYRGLGRFDLPLVGKGIDETTVALRNRGDEALPRPILVLVQEGRISAARGSDLEPGATVRVALGLPETTVEGAMDLVESDLVAAGLFPKEARAMVNTWRRSYFETEGFRVLYAVPRTLVDRLLPLSVEPPPRDTVRVLIGRLDILTPEQEREVQRVVREIATLGEAQERLGRFAAPMLRRIVQIAPDGATRERALALLGETEPAR